tara:strand:+ start:277 stop:459 length:183 start_codon:yes stop_codon:yes gene_type:complete
MTDNNRNGYEIREGLLGMAKDIVDQNAHMEFEATKQWKPVTPDQIKKVAEELYDFVQKKD